MNDEDNGIEVVSYYLTPLDIGNELVTHVTLNELDIQAILVSLHHLQQNIKTWKVPKDEEEGFLTLKDSVKENLKLFEKLNLLPLSVESNTLNELVLCIKNPTGDVDWQPKMRKLTKSEQEIMAKFKRGFAEKVK